MYRTQGAGFNALTRILTLLASLVAAGAAGAPADTASARAESLYSRQQWTDAEAAFLACAAHAPGTAAAAGAHVKAGLCRLKTRDEKGAFALFRQVADDPAAAKSAPDAAASAFDQLHLRLLKQEKRPAREKLIARCRKALPGHPVNARIAEREGDARLTAGASDKALDFYALAGAGLSGTGSNIVRLISAPKPGILRQPLTQADADRLAAVAAARPACGLALCGILSKRGDGWRAEDVRARIYTSQKKFAEAIAVWESLLKAGEGPADELGLVLAETRAFQLGDHARAAKDYGEWLKRFPSSPLREKAEYQRAGALWMSGDFAGAVSAFETFLTAYPSTRFREEAGKTLDRARTDLDYQRKAAQTAAAKKETADDPLVQDLTAADGRLKLERYDEALRLYGRFRGKASTHPLWGRAWYGFGLCRRALGEPEKALDAWDEVLRQAALFTNTLCAAECRRARADVWFEDLAEPDKALPQYLAARAALPPDRTDPALEQRVAQALLALGRGAEARPLFEAFREKESGDPARALLGRPDRPLRPAGPAALRRACATPRRNPDPRRGRACRRGALGQGRADLPPGREGRARRRGSRLFRHAARPLHRPRRQAGTRAARL
ncbi:MAG: tetratricopeptide repeat protein [Kiritimatiellae bacterium]|nr:tetratricopeptide repeat protein [Kiritimatiellia bacterium]